MLLVQIALPLPCSFRLVPTFGRDTIRKFARSVSELKKMAARDYEDLLQCIIPVFEGLLDISHDTPILDLLFRFAHWHGLAKLRLHSELSLAILDEETTNLGVCLRNFQDKTCASFDTQELQREKEARERRSSVKKRNFPPPNVSTSTNTGKTVGDEASRSAARPQDSTSAKAVGRRSKTFKLSGYKAHAMGDYTSTIRKYGTTDSYSTESGELEHRWPKGNYKRTSKKEYKRQLAHIERRQARLWSIKHRTDAMERSNPDAIEILPVDEPALHHQISTSEKHSENVFAFLAKRQGDPAIKNFMEKLKTHLCPRIKEALKVPTGANESNSSLGTGSESVLMRGENLYHHKLMRVNYTTYDARRAQDIFNPRTNHRDIMLLSSSATGHQFRYARIIGIFHVNAIYTGPNWRNNYSSSPLQVLWVRWFDVVDDLPVDSAWKAKHPRLDCIRFKGIDQADAFGFIDPADVLRGAHLIGRFAQKEYYPLKRGRSPCSRDGDDWKYYVVNRFADRDMLMRYHWGLGIGHIYSHAPEHNDEAGAITPLQGTRRIARRSQASVRELLVADENPKEPEDSPDVMQESYTRHQAQEAGDDDRPDPSEGSDESDDDSITLDAVEDGVLDAEVDDDYDSIDELYADTDDESGVELGDILEGSPTMYYRTSNLHAAARARARGEASENESDGYQRYIALKDTIVLLCHPKKAHRQDSGEEAQVNDLDAKGLSSEAEGSTTEGPTEKSGGRKRKKSPSASNHEYESVQAQVHRLRLACDVLVEQRDAAIKERDVARAAIEKLRSSAASAASALMPLTPINNTRFDQDSE
ncbi:hypothetical protein DXG01_004056 [Tephrocybe rancida]|nr:hypothetical protein DXG01_004056 [Tephrocybe rancida]